MISGRRCLALGLSGALVLVACSSDGSDDATPSIAAEPATTAVPGSDPAVSESPPSPPSTAPPAEPELPATGLAEPEPPATAAVDEGAGDTVAPAPLPSPVEAVFRLVETLDDPDGYCVDRPGVPGARLQLPFDMWAHTCHASPLVDQVFVLGRGGSELYYEEFDECLVPESGADGASLRFVACDDAGDDTWTVDDDGRIVVLTDEAEPRCLTVGSSSRVVDNAGNQTRTLTVEACEAADPARSTWEAIPV